MNPAEFLSKWKTLYQMEGPVTHLLKHKFKDKWIRFHNLPDSKRYPESDDERQIILVRQFKILERLYSDNSNLFICYDAGTYNEGCGENCISDGHFKIKNDFDEEYMDDPIWIHFNILPYSIEVASKLLLNVAEWKVSNLLIFDPNLDPIFCPYDGGIDLIMSDIKNKEEIKKEFETWLPKNEAGL